MFHITILNYSNKYLLSGSRINSSVSIFQGTMANQKDIGKIIYIVLDGIEQDA